jgi:RHS repeat-associated protein
VTGYKYDGLGHLREVDLATGDVVTYLVDGLGHRVAKLLNGSVVRRWVYAGSANPIAEVDNNGSALSLYPNGLVVTGGKTYRIVKDDAGTPRLVVDVSSGNVIQQFNVDEWGIPQSDTNPGFQPLGFAGGMYDPDTGLVAFGARDYDPVSGRWTRPDPVRFAAGIQSLYAYVGDDPINNRDPSGLAPRLFDPALPPPDTDWSWLWSWDVNRNVNNVCPSNPPDTSLSSDPGGYPTTGVTCDGRTWVRDALEPGVIPKWRSGNCECAWDDDGNEQPWTTYNYSGVDMTDVINNPPKAIGLGIGHLFADVIPWSIGHASNSVPPAVLICGE